MFFLKKEVTEEGRVPHCFIMMDGQRRAEDEQGGTEEEGVPHCLICVWHVYMYVHYCSSNRFIIMCTSRLTTSGKTWCNINYVGCTALSS